MKICLLGDYSGSLDEGMRKTSFYFAEELAKEHQVLTLDLRDAFTKAFWRDVRNFNPDIIHYIPGATIRSFILLKIASFYCRNAKTVMSAMQPEFSFLSERFIPLFKPDLILTQSHETEEMFKKKGCETEFLPCGVDIKKFMPVIARTKEELREKYGIDKDKFAILHVGSIKKGRNVLLLKELQEKDGANQVVMVGATTTGIEEEILHQLKTVGCIVWTKYFEEKEIREIYALSDCYLFPTTNVLSAIEHPLSVLEAMSCNLPVISTRFGALNRAFEEGDGLIFADKEEEFIQGIEKIKNCNMEIRTREKVLPFSWDAISKKLEDIYENLLTARNMSSGILICFIGIDGSGKSTLAKKLIENMRKHDVETEYTWCKFESSLLRLLIFIKNKLFVREDDLKENYEMSVEIKKGIFKKQFAYALYEWFILLDYRFQIVRKITIPLKFGKNLVCDRYIYDTVVDLAVDLDYSDEKIKNRINQLLDFSPKPDLVFLVDLPEEVAFCRKDDVPSVEFLRKMRKVYKKIEEEFEMVGLDGTKSLQELNEKIEKEVIKLQIVKEWDIE